MTIHINILTYLVCLENQSKTDIMFPIFSLLTLAFIGPSLCAPRDPVFKLTDVDFDHFLKDKDAMLVDFYAPW